MLEEFDAAREGDLKAFSDAYGGDPNAVDEYTGLDLLGTCMIRGSNLDDRLQIARRLVADGADLGYADRKYRRTALHWLFFESDPRPPRYLYDMASLLLGAGADPNALDRYSSIALVFAIANTKGDTDDLAPVYRLLLEAGSDYRHVDEFGKSCLDYAEEYCWRAGFIDIVKEYEDGDR